MWNEILYRVNNNNNHLKDFNSVLSNIEKMLKSSQQEERGWKGMMDLAQLQKKGRSFFEKLVKQYKLEGILVVDLEGLPLLSVTNKEISEEMFAASAASIIASIQMVITDLDKGALKNISIETERGFVVFSQVGNYILVILSPEDVKLGIVRAVMKQAEEFLEK